uniref:At1g61320/AtMIF1 LRR domain-containing protein n=1 Tax=Oryza brachyantha TaxID=4533 RepID=J3MGZ5_ORYBR
MLWDGGWGWKQRTRRYDIRPRVAPNMQNLLEILDADAAAERRLERLSVVVRTVMKCSHLEKLVTLANKFGVNDLHIELHNPTIAGKARFHLILSRVLERLSLCNIVISRMRFKDAEPFGQLAEISFHSVTIASDTFRKAIARCPSLRALDLRRCRLLDVIAILPGVATNLRCHKLERVDVVNSVGVSSLRSVFYSGHFLSSFYLPRTIDALFTDLYICYYGSIVSQVFDKWSQKALPKLSNLSNLTICNNSLQVCSIVSSLCKAGQTSKLAWLGSFQHLTELQLLVLEMTASNLANIFAFLQHVPCPNLRKFFLQLPRIRDSDQQASLGLVNEEMPEDGLDNLRVVRIMNFNLTSIDTQFVSFLLGKARNISKLQLVCPNNNKRPLGVLGPDPIFDLKSSESGDLSTRPCHSEVLFDF